MTRRLTDGAGRHRRPAGPGARCELGHGGQEEHDTIEGGVVFKAGEYVQDTLHFGPRSITVQSGATVRVVDKTKEAAPHTVSLVRKRDLPTGFSPEQCPQCGPLTETLQADEETGEVGVPLVNAGAEGFDVPGDSIFMPPKQPISFKVQEGEEPLLLLRRPCMDAGADQGSVAR